MRQLTPFQGKAIARLLGLPKGLRVIDPLPMLTPESNEIRFHLEATNEALLGRVTGLSCEVVVHSKGTEIIQRAGHGSLRVDPAPLPAAPTRANVQR